LLRDTETYYELDIVSWPVGLDEEPQHGLNA
jgi:hypothetical protein